MAATPSSPTAATTTGGTRAVVVGGNRIPFARAGGPYARVSNLDMLTAALDGLVARCGLQDEVLGEVVLFAQHDRQSASGGIARNSRAIDAATDDQYIAIQVFLRLIHLTAVSKGFFDSFQKEFYSVRAGPYNTTKRTEINKYLCIVFRFGSF